MYVPLHYLVAGGNAYAIDDDNIPFGAAVKLDRSIDWENAYDFDPCDEDVEFVAHMCDNCLLYTSPSPRDLSTSRMPSSA